jgi:hypothetical protein
VATERLRRAAVGVAVAVALSAGLVSAAAAQTSAPYVKVLVDGSPVAFDRPPVIANGRVLVPLRGVFERLGATVVWDAASQTVLAQRGATNISLKISSPQAFVNGQAQFLDMPAMLIGGRTMVPLRFVSQSLGATVSWNATSSTVLISSRGAAVVPPGSVVTAVPPAPVSRQALMPSTTYTPAPAPVPPPRSVTGLVQEVNTSASPAQLTVQTDAGAVYTYQVAPATTITATGVSAPAAVTTIAPGDTVTITADAAGTAQTIQDSYGTVTGTVASAAYDQIRFRNGRNYPVSPIARVVRDDMSVTTAGLHPGDIATLRYNPNTGLVYSVVVPPFSPPAAVSGVTVTPAGRQLVPGDVLTVVATGPPHGGATFTITGLRTAIPMAESATRPGTYAGHYTVQPGDYVTNTTVVVDVTGPDGRVLTATAPAAVSIASAAIIPPAVGGAPVIASPTPGSAITMPFTVTGTAPPGALVRVEADYADTAPLLSVHGTLGAQTVAADANGNWSVTFAAAPPVRQVGVTISASLVDANGAARSPVMSVNTTLQ